MYKNFISEQGRFSMQLPASWIQYGDKEGTYVFFDSTEWSGNFRVTPLLFQDFAQNASSEYLDRVFEKNKTKLAKKIKIDGLNCVVFRDIIEEEEGNQISYYWFLEKGNLVFIFSFSTDEINDASMKNDQELEKVRSIIRSVKILD